MLLDGMQAEAIVKVMPDGLLGDPLCSTITASIPTLLQAGADGES